MKLNTGLRSICHPNAGRHALRAALLLLAGGCSQLPTLSLSPELLRDPVYYQVLGKDKLSLRDYGNDLRQTVARSGEPLSMQPLAYHGNYSEHILVIADRQELQVNKASDAIYVAIEGHGYMESVRETGVVWEHEVVRIPKDTPHAFINAATQPTLIYAVFIPPYDDRQVFGARSKRGTFFIDESTPIGIPQQ